MKKRKSNPPIEKDEKRASLYLNDGNLPDDEFLVCVTCGVPGTLPIFAHTPCKFLMCLKCHNNTTFKDKFKCQCGMQIAISELEELDPSSQVGLLHSPFHWTRERKVTCTACDGKWSGTIAQYSVHRFANDIPCNEVLCIFGCGGTFRLDGVKEHETVCRHRIVECRFKESGCKWTGKYYNRVEHENKEAKSHFDGFQAIINAKDRESKKDLADFKAALAAKNKRIDMLETRIICMRRAINVNQFKWKSGDIKQDEMALFRNIAETETELVASTKAFHNCTNEPLPSAGRTINISTWSGKLLLTFKDLLLPRGLYGYTTDDKTLVVQQIAWG